MPPFDRDAALKAADKALTRGKVDAAIAEYVRVVEAYPRVAATQGRLADAKQFFAGYRDVNRQIERLSKVQAWG